MKPIKLHYIDVRKGLLYLTGSKIVIKQLDLGKIFRTVRVDVGADELIETRWVYWTQKK